MKKESCIDGYKGHEARDHEVINNDGLMELPHDIILSILFFCTMKDVVRTSLVSKKWKTQLLLQDFPWLIFEDPLAMKKIEINPKVARKERSTFVKFVNYVVDQHQGPSIEEFKVVFDLRISCQSHIDKWVVFALSKQAKKLELDLTAPLLQDPKLAEYEKYYNFPQKLPDFNFKHTLTSLCLKGVNLTSEIVDLLLNCFELLETLIIERSQDLASVSSSSNSSVLQLKHLEVSLCYSMRFIDISAPKLLSFTYIGNPTIRVDIRNATLLSKVSIYSFWKGNISFAFDILPKYFSQLEYICLRMYMHSEEVPLGKINHLRYPALPKLKYISLEILGNSNKNSLLGWIPLFEACPRLEKLRLVGTCEEDDLPFKMENVSRNGREFKCLKTLELISYNGDQNELQLITHIIEKATILEEVILAWEPPCMTPPEVVLELRQKLPQRVKFIFMESNDDFFNSFV
ncbi:F-box/FBD/LRR-repeat protein At1g13570-like [Beta vulgaris subsp. vulgaris]|uniref:F-box/FBD/LRR-repeat protein At1g13570-like n=1 Tax=Beta vulgaris subsp. vulgaris TaxID=3555 RepID=UPI0020366B83|nr:F-box/FBD/LRR-repeat protein At1g13570-like [Beta vulgaris subsp. vulgaris]